MAAVDFGSRMLVCGSQCGSQPGREQTMQYRYHKYSDKQWARPDHTKASDVCRGYPPPSA
jgi:hypothetical protein